jgi:hypothetical protein
MFTSDLQIAPMSMMARIGNHNNNKRKKETWKVTGVQHDKESEPLPDSSSAEFCENPYTLKCYLNMIFETCRRKMYEETFLCLNANQPELTSMSRGRTANVLSCEWKECCDDDDLKKKP